MLSRALFIAACAATGACTSTYHPEYHPVTVTTVHETVSTQTTPTSVTPIVVQEPQLADPEVVFKAP